MTSNIVRTTKKIALLAEIDQAVSAVLVSALGSSIDNYTPEEQQAARMFIHMATSTWSGMGNRIHSMGELRMKLDCVGLFDRAMQEAVAKVAP